LLRRRARAEQPGPLRLWYMPHVPRLPWRQREDTRGFVASAGVFQLHVWPEGKQWTGALTMEGLISRGHADPVAAQVEAERLAEEAALSVLSELHAKQRTG
jgi:hypothetical protein